ncbi:MAG: SulP family inorganic anion transporter [bacterium]
MKKLTENVDLHRPGLPLLDHLGGYELENFWGDLVAGITVALVSVPQCIAFAIIANLDPIYGLYAGIVGPIMGSLFASSRQGITGPSAIISLIVGGTLVSVSSASPAAAVIVLTLLVGLIQLLFGVLQIGDLARYISYAVITGFITGGAIVIIGDQLGPVLGIETGQTPYFYARFVKLVTGVIYSGNVHGLSLAMGSGVVIFIVGTRLIDERIPGIFLSIVLAGFVSYFFEFSQYDIELIGHIPASMPTLRFPPLSMGVFSDLFGGALALALLASVQSISIAKSIATTTLEPLDENQELFSQGMANATTGLFGGFPVAMSFTRSFLSYQTGATTQLAGVMSGVIVGLIVLLFAPLAYFIPMSALAGAIIVLGYDILDFDQIKMSLQTTRRDQIAFLATVAFVVFLKLDTAIYAGVVLSLILQIRKATHVDIEEHVMDEEGNMRKIQSADERIHPNVALIDVSGETFFASAERIKSHIRDMIDESSEIRVVILRLKNAANLDITGAIMLKQIAEELQERNRALLICGTTEHIEEILEESGVAEIIGRDKILIAQKSLLESTQQAMHRARSFVEAFEDLQVEKEEELEKDEDIDEDNPPLKYTLERNRNDTDQ